MRRTALLVPLALAACDPDGGLKVTNTAPTASIVSPSDGATVMEQAPLLVSGTVGDANHAVEDLSVSWWIGGEVVCSAAAPAADGSTSCETTLDPGSVEVVLQVVDPAGDSAEDRIVVEVQQGDVPVVDLHSPDGLDRIYAGTPVDVGATVSDGDDAADVLVLAWSSSADGPLALPAAADSDGTVAGAVSLSEGGHELVLTATDPAGHTGSDRLNVTVLSENQAPECGIVEPASAAAFDTGATITFTGTATDVHQPASELAVSWSSDKDGALGSSTADTDGTVTFATSTLSVDTHTVTLSVTDELGEVCTDSVQVAVGNRPEVSIEAPSSGDVVNAGATVTFSGTVSDAEDAAVDLSVSWDSDVDGPLHALPADSSGLTTFQTAGLAVGDHIVTLTATDSAALEGRATVGFTVNGLPTAPVVDLSPDPAVTGDDLTVTVVTDGVDPEGAAVTYAYAWAKDGVVQSAYTTDTVPASATARGETWTAEVQAFDGYGLGAVGSDSVVVGNSAPVISSVVFSPGTLTTNDTAIPVVSGTDADGDALSYSFAWEVDGGSLSTTGSTLDGTTWFDRGQTVTVTVTASDGVDTSAPVSASIVVDNALPEVASVTLSPSVVYTDDTLSALAGTLTDADGDTVTLSYAWTVDGVSTGTTGTTLDGGTWFDRDEVVEVTVTPSDGTDTGTPVTAYVTVRNSAPTAPVVTVTPANPEEDVDDLLCEITTAATDADGDPITYGVEWDVDGDAYPDLDTGSGLLGPYTTTWTDDSVPYEDTVAEEVWTCTVTADDGTDEGPPGDDAVTILTSSTCGNGVLDSGEEYEPAPGPYTDVSVDASTCRWDFSDVEQLYCNGTCTWAGGSSCDQQDADILCKLITDNPLSVATSWTATTALSQSGFSCPRTAYGSVISVSGRGVSVPVYYTDNDIRSTHGAGAVVAYPVCTDP